MAARKDCTEQWEIKHYLKCDPLVALRKFNAERLLLEIKAVKNVRNQSQQNPGH